jgi:hypothetical protein
MARSAAQIFNTIDGEDEGKKYLVRCSYIEIYNEEIRDLLGSDPKMRHDLKESPDKGVYVKGLTMQVVKSITDVEKMINVGEKNRTTGETLMN